jgi:hypothetical protein
MISSEKYNRICSTEGRKYERCVDRAPGYQHEDLKVKVTGKVIPVLS